MEKKHKLHLFCTRGTGKNERKLRIILISKFSFLFILEQNLQNHINKDWKNENSSFYIKLEKNTIFYTFLLCMMDKKDIFF